jgi:hypothetical protein
MTYSCKECGRRLTAHRDPEPEEDVVNVLCLDCEERRDEARMDDHFDDVREERRDDES